MTSDTDLFGAPIAASVAREWVPSAYVDEVTPEPRATPSAWLVNLPGGGRALDNSDLDASDRAPLTPLRNADSVDFMWVERYPEIELVIAEDGSWTVSAQPHPGTKQLCVWGYYDETHDSLDDLVAHLLKDTSRSGPSVAYPILCYQWSESLPFFFSERTGNFETGLAEAPAAGAA